MTAAAETAVVFLKKFRRDVLVAMDVSFFGLKRLNGRSIDASDMACEPPSLDFRMPVGSFKA
jgi:hypothetical protein